MELVRKTLVLSVPVSIMVLYIYIIILKWYIYWDGEKEKSYHLKYLLLYYVLLFIVL